MPALTNVEKRISTDSVWKATFDTNYPQAKEIASKIPLIHVSGHFVSFSNIYRSDCELPLSNCPSGYCSQSTRDAEILIGMPPSLYFYAGRAYQEFGEIALAFPPKDESGKDGSVTPYDTGGFHHPLKYIKWDVLPDDDDGRIDHTKNSLMNLQNWRDTFALFLAAYFNPLQSYWNTSPWQPDPEGLFKTSNGNHWRSWIFEVRYYSKESILNAVAWCASEDQSEILWRDAESLPPLGTVDSCLLEFVENVTELAIGGTPHYCEFIEQWVQENM